MDATSARPGIELRPDAAGASDRPSRPAPADPGSTAPTARPGPKPRPEPPPAPPDASAPPPPAAPAPAPPATAPAQPIPPKAPASKAAAAARPAPAARSVPPDAGAPPGKRAPAARSAPPDAGAPPGKRAPAARSAPPDAGAPPGKRAPPLPANKVAAPATRGAAPPVAVPPLPDAGAGEPPAGTARAPGGAMPPGKATEKAPPAAADAGIAAAQKPDAEREPDVPPIVIEAEAATGGPSTPALMKLPMKGAKPRPPATPPPLPIPGAPLPIPGATVDLRARRVERFLDEGGANLSGQVVDVDGGKPVPNAKVEAWMGTRSIHALADSEGKFAFEGLEPGSRITLWITASPTYVQERTEYAVPSGRPQVSATFKMISRAAVSGAQDGGVGVFLARRGNRTVVNGLVAFGAAERAGLNTGDALLAVGKRSVTDLGPGAIEYLLRGPIGSEVAVTVQSGSQAPRTVTIKRTAR